MTNIDDIIAALLISVMPEVEKSTASLDEMVASLMASVDGGKRSSRDTFNNAWGSSTSPGVVAKQLRANVNELDAELAKLLPNILAKVLLRRVKRDHLSAAEARLTTDKPAITLDDIEEGNKENAGYARMVTIMRDKARLSGRTCGRVSEEVIQQAARLIERSVAPRICDDIVDWKTLCTAGLQARVCRTEGWNSGSAPGVLAADWIRNEDVAERGGPSLPWITWIPQIVAIDPPQLPRGWRHGEGMEVYPATWDAFPADVFYKGFIRELAPDEKPYFLRYEDNAYPIAPFPRWEDLRSLRTADEDFDLVFREAENEARIFDGYRARHRDRLLDLIAAGAVIEREGDLDLFSWSAPLGRRIIPDLAAWDAWRPWGTLFSALKTYLSADDLWDTGSVLRVWAYFLYARHLRDESEFPAFVREEFFDWQQMPVSSNLYGAVRYLVPRDQLPAAKGNRGTAGYSIETDAGESAGDAARENSDS